MVIRRLSLLRQRAHIVRVRPGVGVMVGRRGGFFKKLFKGVAKVAKFVAPAVIAVAKTAAKHTLVGQVVTGVKKVKRLTAAGAAAKAHARQNVSTANAAPTGPAPKAPKRRKAPKGTKAAKRAKGKKAKRAKGKVSAKQAAARRRFAAAAKKGKIRKGAKL